MMDSKIKVDKVKQDIKSEVRLIFGLAFFVMFLGCEALVFLTETNHSNFYVKSLVLILVFICMHIICFRIVGARISSLFEPVDQYVISSTETIYNLNKENQENIDSINEVNRSHAKLIDKANSSARASAKIGKNINRNKEASDKLLRRENEIYQEAKDVIDDIRSLKIQLYDDKDILKNNLNIVNKINSDMSKDYAVFDGAFDKLSDIIVDSMELSDSLLLDIELLQSDVQMLGNNAVKVSLDNARNGAYSFSMTNGLDEIKRISGKVDDKSDSLAEYAISIKNRLKLAGNQSEYCVNEEKNTSKSFAKLKNYSDEVSGGVTKVIDCTEELLAYSNKLSELLSELERLKEKKQNIIDNTYSESDEVVGLINNMGESLKNK